MKKSILIFAAILLMAGFTSQVMAQSTDTKSNNANASILGAITLTAVSPLDFGGIIPGAGGSVVLSPSNVATPTVVTLVAGTGQAAASYTVTGTGLATYAITIPTVSFNITNTTSGNSETMAVTAMTCSKGTASVFASGGTDAFTVGGTLTIASAQVAGVYTGAFDVTVAYN